MALVAVEPLQSSGRSDGLKMDTGARLGHYEILGPLGKGGMGEVTGEPFDCEILETDVTTELRQPPRGKRIHDGAATDYFHLLKIGDRWSIVSKLWDAD